jgi:hypothetical protein
MPREYYLELIRAKVRPAEHPWDEGIDVKDGHSLPFHVERGWSGPAGHYWEQWSIRRDGTTLYSSAPREIWVRGMQSVTTHTDRVDDSFSLEPGDYQLVFLVHGYLMGEVTITAASATDAAA